jgi:hypothetical protein
MTIYQGSLQLTGRVGRNYAAHLSVRLSRVAELAIRTLVLRAPTLTCMHTQPPQTSQLSASREPHYDATLRHHPTRLLALLFSFFLSVSYQKLSLDGAIPTAYARRPDVAMLNWQYG